MFHSYTVESTNKLISRDSDMTVPFKLTIKAMTALVFTTLLLAGCGQKGDLYLPEDASAPKFTQQ